MSRRTPAKEKVSGEHGKIVKEGGQSLLGLSLKELSFLGGAEEDFVTVSLL